MSGFISLESRYYLDSTSACIALAFHFVSESLFERKTEFRAMKHLSDSFGGLSEGWSVRTCCS